MSGDSRKPRNSVSVNPNPEANIWKVVNQDSDILPVHAALLKNGKVLMFGGSQNDMQANRQHYVNVARLWNPLTNFVETVHSPLDIDLFCCGQAMLSNGDVLAAGGTDSYPCDSVPQHRGRRHFGGIRNCVVFNSSFSAGTSPWKTAASMNYERNTDPPSGGGRWYPTVLMLGDGRVLALGGHPSNESHIHKNRMLEIFDVRNGLPGTWIDQGFNSDDVYGDDEEPLLFPRMFLMPDGNVFVVRMKDDFSYIWNPQTKNWTNLLTQPLPYSDVPAVLLPLLPSNNYKASILIATPQPQRIDFDRQNPFWKNTSARKLQGSPARFNSSAIILPNGKVVIVGGVPNPADDNSALASHTTIAEIYDPVSDSWENLAEAKVIRNYHSVALLLPDGSVWTAGSNKNSQTSWLQEYPPECIPSGAVDGAPNPQFDTRELRIEVYYPSYMGISRRPVISSVDKTEIIYNSPFVINSNQAEDISTVALIRCSSATHAFNPDQRYVGLVIQRKIFGTVTVVSPPNSNIAPPGYYMLFIVDSGNMPSVAVIVHLTH